MKSSNSHLLFIVLFLFNCYNESTSEEKESISMNTPQTIDGLMRHLRDECNIQIGGSYQKKQLISYGYYHGYKGYRFIKNSQNRIPYATFSEVVTVIEYDNNLKAALYSDMMFIETAIKNIFITVEKMHHFGLYLKFCI